jgi:hypothetical protein
LGYRIEKLISPRRADLPGRIRVGRAGRDKGTRRTPQMVAFRHAGECVPLSGAVWVKATVGEQEVAALDSASAAAFGGGLHHGKRREIYDASAHGQAVA